MIYKIFLDINILIDFFVASRLNHMHAVEIFSLTERKLIKGYISESVICTVAWLLSKDYPAKELRDIFDKMLDIFTLLSCTERICKNSFTSTIPDIEDAVLYNIALHNKVDYFITNDKTDFRNINQKEFACNNIFAIHCFAKAKPLALRKTKNEVSYLP